MPATAIPAARTSPRSTEPSSSRPPPSPVTAPATPPTSPTGSTHRRPGRSSRPSSPSPERGSTGRRPPDPGGGGQDGCRGRHPRSTTIQGETHATALTRTAVRHSRHGPGGDPAGGPRHRGTLGRRRLGRSDRALLCDRQGGLRLLQGAGPHRRRRREVRRAERHPLRLRAVQPAVGVQPALGDGGFRPYRRDRRRLRRPDRGSRPGGLPQPVRPAGLHHRQRLLQEDRPERRHHLPAQGRRLGTGDLAGPRHGLGDLPQLPHPAGRGQVLLLRQPGRGGEPGGGHPRCRRDQQQLRRLRRLRRVLRLLLQPPGHRGDRQLR
ncbi:hypothetical protein SBRY_40333 [Actinacidiphila bryophytorum]|uniref:Uncharacterized protein n=1 Tax=Actinacidiphila bryophytorum TaxID=1436133 RepID=A0A9W4H2R1_9ACTN|nr:hypothetical protein SBRY_40333 [Actinacidiphila bryophytorum]